MIWKDQAVKWKIKRISKYKAPHHTDKIILTTHPLWYTLEICCCHSGILKPCKLLDANTSSGLKMAKNPKKLLGIARKKREPAIQKVSKLLYILTVTWPQLENCEAFVSPFDKCIVELKKKKIENSHKVGQQYKISSECWKIKQTGIF